MSPPDPTTEGIAELENAANGIAELECTADGFDDGAGELKHAADSTLDGMDELEGVPDGSNGGVAELDGTAHRELKHCSHWCWRRWHHNNQSNWLHSSDLPCPTTTFFPQLVCGISTISSRLGRILTRTPNLTAG